MQTISAGSLVSCDVLVNIQRCDEPDIKIEVDSVVNLQYGSHLKKLVEQEVKKFFSSGIKVKLVDNGALDYVIKARVKTACLRLKEAYK